MHLADCEIADVEVKGKRLVILYGPTKINATEAAALLSQFGATHGGPVPIFASPDGWQVLEPAPAAVPEVSAPVVAEPAPKAARKTLTP